MQVKNPKKLTERQILKTPVPEFPILNGTTSASSTTVSEQIYPRSKQILNVAQFAKDNPDPNVKIPPYRAKLPAKKGYESSSGSGAKLPSSAQKDWDQKSKKRKRYSTLNQVILTNFKS